MRISIKVACLLTVILLEGCNFPTPASTSLSPTPAVGMSQISPLTLEQLKNYPFLGPAYNMIIPFKDGKFETRMGADNYFFAVLPETAFGDLNGDGVEDAAVLLSEDGGGTGVFISLISVLNVNGEPMQTGSEYIGDRIIIQSLIISDGRIILDAIIHGPGDPLASPSMKATETYQCSKKGLILTRFVSSTSDGSERSITIESPKNGDQVSGAIQVQGSMPIGPFENTLAYRIYDQSGNKLAEGPFMVNSNGTGGAATFDAPIDISTIPLGIVISLQLVDISMADGSILALDSVELFTK